jgi:single-strand DNA-binding protein
MVNINFCGRLGADAEVRQMQDGTQFLSFNVAVRDIKKKEKITTWLRVRYDNVGLGQFLKKGSNVYVSGIESVSLYTNKNNEVQISRDVKAHAIEFIGESNNENTASTTVAQTVMMPKVENVNSEEITCGVFKPQTPQTPQAVAMATTVASSSFDDDLPF